MQRWCSQPVLTCRVKGLRRCRRKHGRKFCLFAPHGLIGDQTRLTEEVLPKSGLQLMWLGFPYKYQVTGHGAHICNVRSLWKCS